MTMCVSHAELAIIVITAKPKTTTLCAEQTGRLTEWQGPHWHTKDQCKSVVCALTHTCMYKRKTALMSGIDMT